MGQTFTWKQPAGAVSDSPFRQDLFVCSQLPRALSHLLPSVTCQACELSPASIFSKNLKVQVQTFHNILYTSLLCIFNYVILYSLNKCL